MLSPDRRSKYVVKCCESVPVVIVCARRRSYRLSIVGPGADLFLGKFSSFLAEVTKSIGHDFEKNFAGMRHQREASVFFTLGPILLFG